MEYEHVLGKKCAAYNCRLTEYNLINGYRVSSGVQFFSLFVNERARVKWSRVIERPNETNKYRASLKTILCEKHFAEAQLANETRDNFNEKTRHKTKTKVLGEKRKVVKPSNNITWKYVTIEQKSKIPSLREIVEKHVAKKKQNVVDTRKTKNENTVSSNDIWNDNNYPTSFDQTHQSTRCKALPTIELTVHDTDSDLSLITNHPSNDTTKYVFNKQLIDRSDDIKKFEEFDSAGKEDDENDDEKYVNKDKCGGRNVIKDKKNVDINSVKKLKQKEKQYEFDNCNKHNGSKVKKRNLIDMSTKESEGDAESCTPAIERDNIPGFVHRNARGNVNIGDDKNVDSVNESFDAETSTSSSNSSTCDIVKVKKIIHGKNIEEIEEHEINNMSFEDKEKIGNKKLINEMIQDKKNEIGEIEMKKNEGEEANIEFKPLNISTETNDSQINIPMKVEMSKGTDTKLSSPIKVKPCSSNLERRFESRSFSYSPDRIPNTEYQIRSRHKSCESEMSFMSKQRSSEDPTSPTRSRRFSYTHCSSPTSSTRKLSNNAYPRFTIEEETDSSVETVIRHDMTGVTLRKCFNYIDNNSDKYKKQKSKLERSNSTKDNEELHKHIFTSELNLVNHIKSSDRPCHYYTGFSTLKHLYNVFEDIRCQHWENLNFYHDQLYNRKSGERKLSPFDGYMLTLVRLKRNFSIIHLAFLFEVSESTVSTLLRTWIDFLYKYDSSMWPSTTQIYKTCDSVEERIALQNEVKESLSIEPEKRGLYDKSRNIPVKSKDKQNDCVKNDSKVTNTQTTNENEGQNNENVLNEEHTTREENFETKSNENDQISTNSDINQMNDNFKIHSNESEQIRTNSDINQKIVQTEKRNNEPVNDFDTKTKEKGFTVTKIKNTTKINEDEKNKKHESCLGENMNSNQLSEIITDINLNPTNVTSMNSGTKLGYETKVKQEKVNEITQSNGPNPVDKRETKHTTVTNELKLNNEFRTTPENVEDEFSEENYGLKPISPNKDSTQSMAKSYENENKQESEMLDTIKKDEEKISMNQDSKTKIEGVKEDEPDKPDIPHIPDLPYEPDIPYVHDVPRENEKVKEFHEEVEIKTEMIREVKVTYIAETIETIETKYEEVNIEE